jgi:hypothetical protein
MNNPRNTFPAEWDDNRVRELLEHYEHQSEEEAVAEDEASMDDSSETTMQVPHDLVPAVRDLIAKRSA